MKHCSRCDQSLDESAFAKNRAKPDGLQTYCRACKNPLHKAYYGDNRDRWRTRAAAQRESLRLIMREAKDRPCLDCGGSFPACVMDFDHRGDKKANVGDMVSRAVSEQQLRAEIAKCDVVCANCHRIRTHGPIV